MIPQWDQNFDEVGFEFSSKYGLTRYFQSFLLIQESGNVFKLKLLQKAFYPIVKYISVTVSGVRSMRVCHSYVGNFLNDPLSNLDYTCFMKDDMHTWAKLMFIYSICTKSFFCYFLFYFLLLGLWCTLSSFYRSVNCIPKLWN